MDEDIDGQFCEPRIDMGNVINIDGTTAVYIDGQYYIPTNSKALLLPENENQYVVNEAGKILLNENNFETILSNSGMVHFIDDSQLIAEEENQIVYYTNDHSTISTIEEESSQFSLIDNNHSASESGSEYINIQSLFNVDNTEVQDGNLPNCHYIVQLDNSEPIENSEYLSANIITEIPVNNMHYNVVDEGLNNVDYSKITGKNLLTGQTVTLDSYLQKVWNSNKELTLKKAEEASQNIRRKCHQNALSNLLNRKLTIGKTLSGQKLVGKVIHVGKKNVDMTSHTSENPNCTQSVVKVERPEGESEEIINNAQILNFSGNSIDTEVPNTGICENNEDLNISGSKEKQINIIENLMETEQQTNIAQNSLEHENETFVDPNQNMVDYVSKTLSNMMSMESVAKKLKRKNLAIKITQKVVQDQDVKINVFHMKGHLEMLGGWEDDSFEEKWLFRREDESPQRDGRPARRFPKTMRMTISIVQTDGMVQSTKVNLNYCQERCSVCRMMFTTVNKLKVHMKSAHFTEVSQFYCQICDIPLKDKEEFDNHQKNHGDKNDMFPCSKCVKQFTSKVKLTRHALTHVEESRDRTCKICGETYRKVSAWRRHMLTHTNTNLNTCRHCYKQFVSVDELRCHERTHEVKNCYVCKVCNRTFSRYSNLQRHAEIHGTKNTMSNYSCTICGCTYNYVSSLTRHIVQNHISST